METNKYCGSAELDMDAIGHQRMCRLISLPDAVSTSKVGRQFGSCLRRYPFEWHASGAGETVLYNSSVFYLTNSDVTRINGISKARIREAGDYGSLNATVSPRAQNICSLNAGGRAVLRQKHERNQDFRVVDSGFPEQNDQT